MRQVRKEIQESFMLARRLFLLVALVAASLVRAEPPVPAPIPIQETDWWESVFLGSQKIGYTHTQTERVDAKGQVVVRTRFFAELKTKRFDDLTKTTLLVEVYELPTGKVYAVDTRMKAAGEEIRTRGRLDDSGKFNVEIQTPGSRQNQAIDWADDVVGPYAQERSLKTQPMKPGETRSQKTYLPELHQIGTQTLKGIRMESTELKGEKRELLLIEESSDKLPLVRSIWVDPEGSILKSTIPFGGMAMISYRTSQAEAMGEPIAGGFDIGYQTLVKPDRPIEGAHRARSITYQITATDAKAAESIPEAAYQKILERSGTVVRIQVHRAIPPADPAAQTIEPEPEFTEPNGFLQSDDPLIQETARQVTDGARTPWEKVTRLEAWVDRNMSDRDFSIGFATAGEVIRTKQGDCTEHAVLLAALCRAAGIPARVAMGLVYLQGTDAFAYHMWTEVRLGGVWYAADGTLGLGSIGGGHIKLADSSLKGVGALGTFLPVANMLGKLQIKVLKVEP